MSKALAALLFDLETKAESLDVPQIREMLRPHKVGMSNFGYELPQGSFLYRARKCTPQFNTASKIFLHDLSYPPAHLVQRGRANDVGSPVFYCSTSKQPVFFELPDLQPGSHVIVSIWQTTQSFWLNNIGFTDYVFSALGANRPRPKWSGQIGASPSASSKFELKDSSVAPQINPELVSPVLNDEVRELFSQWFMRKDFSQNSHKYKITTAIAELHLGPLVDLETKFAGIMYPSVGMAANGDNLAILPEFVDHALQWKKAVHVRIDNRSNNSFETNKKDDAILVDAEGKLEWLGRTLNWQVPPKRQYKFAVVEGVDRFGDYEIGKNGEPLNWKVTDERGSIVDSR